MTESTMTQPTAKVMKEKLLEDFNGVVTDAEQLLKSMTNDDGDMANALRAKVEQNLKVTKERLHHLEEAAVEKTKAAARTTDEYVHEHPWQTIGVAAGLGVVIGLLLNRR